MNKRTKSCILAVAACLLLAGCSSKKTAIQQKDPEPQETRDSKPETTAEPVESPAPAAGTDEPMQTEEYSDEYVGEWWDANGESCSLDIACDDGVYYYIDINWSSGTRNNTHWSFVGTYDENQNGIIYHGRKLKEHYPKGQEMQITDIYSDGEGLIFIGTDGMLYWEDHKENAGAGCMFQKN